jgi:hypothetical protein
MKESELNGTEWLILRAVREMLNSHAEHFPNKWVDVHVEVESEDQPIRSKYRLGMSGETLMKEYGVGKC